MSIDIRCPTCGARLDLVAHATCLNNDDYELCDAYHEAGHAVIGVALGLNLTLAASAACKLANPKCEFDHGAFNEMLKKGDPGDKEKIIQGTESLAIMLFASEFAEALVCDMRSTEQQEAIHGDYFDAQVARKGCGLPYLSARDVARLKERARNDVRRLEPAIRIVGDRLRRGERLDRNQVQVIASAEQSAASDRPRDSGVQQSKSPPA